MNEIPERLWDVFHDADPLFHGPYVVSRDFSGGTLASVATYVAVKRFSKHPEKFGTGAIEGVAATEAANNSAASGSFIPLLTLGLPSNVSTYNRCPDVW